MTHFNRKTVYFRGMQEGKTCDCGSCGHESVQECYKKECKCCLSDHQGAFAKNR